MVLTKLQFLGKVVNKATKNYKNKFKILIVVMGVLAFGIILILLSQSKDKQVDLSNIENELDIIYEEQNIENVDETSNETGNEILITDKEIEYYQMLNPNVENIENEITESKILSSEAKMRNIELTEENIEYIDTIINNEEFLEGLEDEEKEDVQNILSQYIEDEFLVANLRSQILKEIQEGKLSIQDEELEKLMQEYKELQEQTKKIEESQKKELLNKIYNKLIEIQDLYCLKIVEKDKINN